MEEALSTLASFMTLNSSHLSKEVDPMGMGGPGNAA